MYLVLKTQNRICTLPWSRLYERLYVLTARFGIQTFYCKYRKHTFSIIILYLSYVYTHNVYTHNIATHTHICPQYTHHWDPAHGFIEPGPGAEGQDYTHIYTHINSQYTHNRPTLGARPVPRSRSVPSGIMESEWYPDSIPSSKWKPTRNLNNETFIKKLCNIYTTSNRITKI